MAEANLTEARWLLEQWAVWRAFSVRKELGYPSITPFRKMYHMGGDKPFIDMMITEDEGADIDKAACVFLRESPKEYRIMEAYFRTGSVARVARELKVSKNGVLAVAEAGAEAVYHIYHQGLYKQSGCM